MSAMGTAQPEITLAELDRLVRMLGMLGSEHDGEVLAAARFAVRWVREHGTDWNALLTPEPEPGVVSVGTVQDDTSLHQDQIKAVYDRGYQDGMKTMAAHVKAQAMHVQNFQTQMNATQQSQGPYANQGISGLGSGLASGLGPGAGLGTPYNATNSAPASGPTAQQPPPSWAVPGASNPCTPATWKAVAWQLLHNHTQGMPGVFRGSREEQFVVDILNRGFPNLTAGQETWLRDIAGRSGMTW